MSTTATFGTKPLTTASLVRNGGAFLIGAAATALVLTAAAAFIDRSLARPGAGGYLASGIVMTLVDLFAALGLTGLAGTDAVGPGRFKQLAFGLAIGGSFAMVPAEVLLRIDFATGNAAYGIVGPIQAIGLILVGIGIVRARRWSSWRRFVVLFWGIYVPAVMVPLLAASGGTSLVALAGYHGFALAAGVAYLGTTARTTRT